VRDPGVGGNPVRFHRWVFTTGEVIAAVWPIENDDEVGLLESDVRIAYTNTVSSAPAGSFTLKKGGTPVAATVDVAGDVVRLRATAGFEANTTYTAKVTKQVLDQHGNPVLEEKTWTFKTKANP
jgi:Bacterial Ig-like domain